jgi:hypothetical protein
MRTIPMIGIAWLGFLPAHASAPWTHLTGIGDGTVTL